MSKQVKRQRGRLPKADQLAKDLQKMEGDLKEALLKGNQMVAQNYMAYMKTLDDAARGIGEVSETNKISCAKVLAKKAEDYFKEVKKSSEENEDSDTEETTAPVTSNLISLEAVNS